MATNESPVPEGTSETSPVNETTAVTPPASTEPSCAAGKAMSAFIVGYTGEVGKELVKELAKRNTFQKLKLIGRRFVEYEDEAISKNPAIEQVQVNFDELEKSKEVFEGLQVGFCCLGTTRGSAGKDGQWKVDHDYVVKTAELAKAGGCQQYHLVTSKGSDAKSMLYYGRLKGQTEEDVKAVGIERTSIYRPGMLLTENRGGKFSRGLISMLDSLSPGSIANPTHVVAKAMSNNVSKKLEVPAEIIDAKEIQRLGTKE